MNVDALDFQSHILMSLIALSIHNSFKLVALQSTGMIQHSHSFLSKSGRLTGRESSGLEKNIKKLRTV